jgi:hypothetical protein
MAPASLSPEATPSSTPSPSRLSSFLPATTPEPAATASPTYNPLPFRLSSFLPATTPELAATVSPTSNPPSSRLSSFLPATISEPAATVSSPLISPVPLASASTLPTAAVAGGRSKPQRWREVSLSDSTFSTSSPPSFRDVVIAAPAPTRSGSRKAKSSSHSLSREKFQATITTRCEDCLTRPSSVDAGGWQLVESRRSRRRRLFLKQEPRSRRVPVDLVGRCFNCLSPHHFAKDCWERSRCFCCGGLGHLSYKCSAPRRAEPRRPVWRSLGPTVAPVSKKSVWDRLGSTMAHCDRLDLLSSSSAGAAPERIPVWRRITPGSDASQRAEPAVLTGSSVGGPTIGGETRPAKRRRRRQRKRSLAPIIHEDADAQLAPVSSPTHDSASPVLEDSSPPSFPCIIGWNQSMSRVEEDLATTVVITVFGNMEVVSANDIAAPLASRLEVDEGSLVIRQLSTSSFLLMLPSDGLVQQLCGRWSVVRANSFSLSCKRWSRLMNSSGSTLAQLLEVELDGIPVHAWKYPPWRVCSTLLHG